MKRLTLFLLLCLTAGSVSAQTAWKPFEQYDFAHQKLRPQQLKPLTVLDLKYMRGLVFGRHGRRFDEAAIQDFLQTRPWYKPNTNYKVTDLNAIERANMDQIKTAEWKRHAHAEPGDMRFYTHHVLTAKEFGPHSALEWQIMAGEVEAWEGRPFSDQPWLQQYFAERYWYHPRQDYSSRRLTSAELVNLATIQNAEKSQRHLALAPGDMGLFEETSISAPMLRGLNLYELRILRNEIFARHGAKFRTAWLQDYFNDQPWYQPRPDLGIGDRIALSPVEKKNAALILQAEADLHQQLSSKPVSPTLLKGLSADDARKLRNEIYARHGKIFHDAWLNDYFRSQSWYKPDPSFREASLSGVERANAAQIKAFEERGRKQLMTAAA